MNRAVANWLQAPSILVLFLWMAVPLSMTLYFSFQRYILTKPQISGFAGWRNYTNFASNEFWSSIGNTLTIVIGILLFTLVLGLLIAMLINRAFPGRGIVRVLLISPFFIMPAVNALMWKNLMLNPTNGLIAYLHDRVEGLGCWLTQGGGLFNWIGQFSCGSDPINLFDANYGVYGIILIVAWQWTPFAILIFMTSLQSEDQEQKEAAVLDGASPWSQFWNLTLPHLARPIAIVMMIQLIFHLSLYAEIFYTGASAGAENLAFAIDKAGLGGGLNFGKAAAGGVFSILLANIAAIVLIRIVGRNLTD